MTVATLIEWFGLKYRVASRRLLHIDYTHCARCRRLLIHGDDGYGWCEYCHLSHKDGEIIGNV